MCGVLLVVMFQLRDMGEITWCDVYQCRLRMCCG